SMNFYPTTKTLTIQGPNSSYHRDRMVNLLKDWKNQKPNENAAVFEDSDRSNGATNCLLEDTIHDSNDTLIIPSSYDRSNTPLTRDEFLHKFNALQTQINDLKLQLRSTYTPLNKGALEEENRTLRIEIEQLKRENTRLSQEKEHLVKAFDILTISKNHQKYPDNQTVHVQDNSGNSDVNTENLHKTPKKKKKKSKNKGQDKNDLAHNNGTSQVPTPSKHSPPNEVFIVGDSMVKNLQGHKMSRNQKIKVWTFRGSTACDMKEYIKPILQRKPKEIVLHVGTNSVQNLDAKACAEQIMQIGSTISNENIKPTISGIIKRRDNSALNKKAMEVNTILKDQCKTNGIPFIDHSNIDPNNNLNRSGLHLNKQAKRRSSTLNSEVFGRGLVMALLNINSLLGHIDELRLFLKTSKIDILAINETKLDSLIGNDQIAIPGFDVTRRDRPTDDTDGLGGGVCFYTKTDINFKIRPDLSNDLLEFLTLEIIRPQSTSFLVSTWYRPPDSSRYLFKVFEDIIDKIDAISLDYYLLGDINCDFLDPSKSRSLATIFDVYGLTQLISEPTRITESSRTLIDLCVTNSPDKIPKS
ncbi:hypothetical protein AC249_AIPGENE4972, partial [Exaiptasia diaphana]